MFMPAVNPNAKGVVAVDTLTTPVEMTLRWCDVYVDGLYASLLRNGRDEQLLMVNGGLQFVDINELPFIVNLVKVKPHNLPAVRAFVLDALASGKL